MLAHPRCRSAAVTVGLAFAVMQITNLLLPGFVVHALGGDSNLFGPLEMVAVAAGMVAVAAASIPSVASRLNAVTTVILAVAGVALVLFSFAKDPSIAVILYGLAGVLWSVARAGANGFLLTVVALICPNSRSKASTPISRAGCRVGAA